MVVVVSRLLDPVAVRGEVFVSMATVFVRTTVHLYLHSPVVVCTYRVFVRVRAAMLWFRYIFCSHFCNKLPQLIGVLLCKLNSSTVMVANFTRQSMNKQTQLAF